MGLHRENLAVDTETADAVGRTELQCFHQGRSIGGTEIGQFLPALITGQTLDGRRRGGAELDRLIPKDAAQAETNHGIFIQQSVFR